MKPPELIYFDNNATTKVDPMVLEEMLPWLAEHYGNPSSAYRLGQQAGQAMEQARERVAALLEADPGEIIFTSCGTESTNAAIHSALSMDPDRQHIVTTRVEHSATLKTCEALAKQGTEITWLSVDGEGRLDLDALAKAVRPDTALVSIMWANNETGVLFPVHEAAEIVRQKGALFHSDAVQAIGKVPVRLQDAKINYLSLSGHKLHCPKGIGALYVNRRTRFHSFLTGGSQESGKRAGTQNVASIVALGKACELAAGWVQEEATRVRALRDRFETSVLERLPGTQVNGDREHRLPNTSSIAFEGLDSEAVLMLLDQRGLCCSAGSACTTGSLHPSHVLKGMGFSDDRARSSLRFSFSRYNTEGEIDRALELLPEVTGRLQRIAAAA